MSFEVARRGSFSRASIGSRTGPPQKKRWTPDMLDAIHIQSLRRALIEKLADDFHHATTQNCSMAIPRNHNMTRPLPLLRHKFAPGWRSYRIEFAGENQSGNAS